ncbi:MAG: hypothetical protein ABI855_14450, partial [Bacteroidota bacterium]
MNKLFCLIVMFVACGVCEGQNLVPNWSFENYTSCPTQLGQVDSVLDWFQVTQSPDYFNSCAVIGTSVPNNGVGYQLPVSGNAYCGMICYYPNSAREYIGTHLTSTLVVGQKYFVSFNLCLANNFYLVGSNKFGCKFSKVPFIYNSVLPDNQASYYDDSIITDTLNWTFIKGSFIADSAY